MCARRVQSNNESTLALSLTVQSGFFKSSHPDIGFQIWTDIWRVFNNIQIQKLRSFEVKSIIFQKLNI